VLVEGRSELAQDGGSDLEGGRSGLATDGEVTFVGNEVGGGVLDRKG
jgi:hypothetical protein